MKTIYSHHAQERISYRHLSAHDIELTILNPDKTFKIGEYQTKYIKMVNGRKYHVITKSLPEQDARLVISAWVRGENDPESLLTTIILAPFRIIWDIVKFLWNKMRSHPPKSKPTHKRS